MWKAFKSLWKNVFNFKGKASRKEFWLGSIAEIVFMYLLFIPTALIVVPLRYSGVDIASFVTVWCVIHIGGCLLPLVSLYVRRANDVGLGVFDTIFTAIVVPCAGAMFIGILPSCHTAFFKGSPMCVRGFALGIGIFVYSCFISTLILDSINSMLPFAGIGLGLMTVSMVTGAILTSKK